MEFFNDPEGPAPVESEDCLYLNVFTPATATTNSGLSVLYWIFGGDLEFGDAGIPPYDGSSFAAHQNVIVVTANYRTNIFGFSGSPEIPPGSNNAGFLDQRKGLEWVQENIEAFGGDPTKVTIFGQSAGGYSVKQLLAVPPSPLTYRSAILESEALSSSGTGLQNWEELVAAVNCTTATSQIACVRALPATTIQNAIEVQELSFPPAYDGVTAVEDVRGPITSKQFANVPILMGTNSNEGRIFVYVDGITPNAGEPELEAFLNSTFPNDPALQQAIIAAYPTSLTTDVFELAGQILTDYVWTCTTSAIANLATSNGYHVWRYYFNASFPNTKLFPDAGAYHSSEIPEVFGTYPAAGATTTQAELSQYMQTAWADFAKDPANGPGWPRIGTNFGVELGDLGGVNSGGEKTIPTLVVDYICAVYDPIIAAQPL